MKIRTCDNKGIHIIHDNGIRFSIQFGAGNYCRNRGNDSFEQFSKKPDTVSDDCEVAVMDDLNEKWVTNLYFPENGEHEDGQVDVYGYCPVEIALKRAINPFPPK